jgi:hypothetical protein
MGKYKEKFRTIVVLLSTWAALLLAFFVYDQYYVAHQEEYFRDSGFRVLATLESDLNSLLVQTSNSVGAALKLVDPSLNKDDETERLRKARIYFRTYLRQIRVNAGNSAHRAAECNPNSLDWRVSAPGLQLDLMCVARNADNPSSQVGSSTEKTTDPEQRFYLAGLRVGDWIQRSFEEFEDNYFDVIVVADSEGEVLYQSGPSGLSVRAFGEVAEISHDKRRISDSSTSVQPSADNDAHGESTQTKTTNHNLKSFGALSASSGVGTIQLDGEDFLLFTQPIRPIEDMRFTNVKDQPRILVLAGLIRTLRFQSESRRLSYSSLIWGYLLVLTIFSLTWPLFKLQYMNSKERFKPKQGLYLCIAILSAAASLTLMLLNVSYASQTTKLIDGNLGLLADRIKRNAVNEMDLAFLQLESLKDEATKAVNRRPVEPPISANSQKPSPTAARQYQFANQLCSEINYLSSLYRDQATCGPISPSSQASNLPYPFFEFAVWADCDGIELAEFTTRHAATPATRLQQFAFFQKPISGANIIRDEQGYQLGVKPTDGERKNLTKGDIQSGCEANEKHLKLWEDFEQRHLEELISPNTGDTLVLLSAPFTHDDESNCTEIGTTAIIPNCEKIAVEALAFKPISLIDPIIPPHYNFAVIDRKCRVWFHGNSTRNLRENFCDESKDPTELTPWLKSGGDHPFNITYQGKDERAYLTDLPVGPITREGEAEEKLFLIVFREPGIDATENVAIMLVSGVLLAVYFTFLAVIAFCYLFYRKVRRRNYPPAFVWPDPKKAGIYVQIFLVNTLTLVIYHLGYTSLFGNRLLFLTTCVVAFVSLFTFLKLASPYRIFGRVNRRHILRLVTACFAACGCFAFLALVLEVLYARYFSPHVTGALKISELYEDLVICGILTIFGLVGFLLSGTQSYLKQWSIPRVLGYRVAWRGSLQSLAEKHFTTGYILVCTTLVIALSVIPVLGVFKYSYDSIRELSSKHEELSLSDRLEKRRERIRNYYSEAVRASPETIETRFDGIKKSVWQQVPNSGAPSEPDDIQELDRYDSLFFTVQNPPKMQDSAQKSVVIPKHQADGAASELSSPIRNFILEVLRIPSTQYGSDISRLAATRGIDSPTRWETYWTKEDENKFSLRWETYSRFPSFRIDPVNSASWVGMNGKSSAILYLTMAVLCLWLRKITQTLFPPHREVPIALSTVDWHDLTDIDRDYLVLGRAQSGKTDRMRSLTSPHDSSYCDLRLPSPRINPSVCSSLPVGMPPQDGQPDMVARVLILDHFEFNIKNPKSNYDRLTLLEGLPSNLRQVLVSTVDPLYYFTDEGSSVVSEGLTDCSCEQLLDRWSHILSKFKKVGLKDTNRRLFYEELRTFIKAHRGCGGEHATRDSKFVNNGDLRPLLNARPNCQQFALWIYRECRCTALLRSEGIQQLKGYSHSQQVSRDWLVRYIGSVMDAHYHVIWSDLTRRERTVLYQLALDGWANPHPENERAIEQLERKGLISKRLMFCVMNSSFSNFVRSTEHLDEIRAMNAEAAESSWQAAKIILVAVAVGFFVWLLWAEAELFRIGMAYLAAIGAVITTAVNFFSGSKRTSTPSTSEATSV